MINVEINTNENFWEMNPDARLIFKERYEEDTSDNKTDSSRYMWAYTLLYHPRSILSEFSYTERLDYIRNSFLYEPEWDPEENSNTHDTYKRFMLTRKQRILVNWEKQFDERERFLNDITYEEHYEIKEKLMAATKKLWDEFSRAAAEVDKEKEESAFGGAIESATEQGKI